MCAGPSPPGTSPARGLERSDGGVMRGFARVSLKAPVRGECMGLEGKLPAVTPVPPRRHLAPSFLRAVEVPFRGCASSAVAAESSSSWPLSVLRVDLPTGRLETGVVAKPSASWALWPGFSVREAECGPLRLLSELAVEPVPADGAASPDSLQFHKCRFPFFSASPRSEFSLTTCHTLMVHLKTSAGFGARMKQSNADRGRRRPLRPAPWPRPPAHAHPRCGVHADAAQGRALAISAHRPGLATSPRPECGPQRCWTWPLEPRSTWHLDAGCRRPGVRSQAGGRPLAPKPPPAASALSSTFSDGLAIRSGFW